MEKLQRPPTKNILNVEKDYKKVKYIGHRAKCSWNFLFAMQFEPLMIKKGKRTILRPQQILEDPLCGQLEPNLLVGHEFFSRYFFDDFSRIF